jgi:hypothetical protein
MPCSADAALDGMNAAPLGLVAAGSALPMLAAIELAYHLVGERVAELRRQLHGAEAEGTDYMAANVLPCVGRSGPDFQQSPNLRCELLQRGSTEWPRRGGWRSCANCRRAAPATITLLRRRYDFMELGVAPALGIIESQAIGMLANAALFVVRCTPPATARP